MFEENDEDCVFMETAMNLKRLPHLVIECVPLPKHIGDTAPIYFKVISVFQTFYLHQGLSMFKLQ